MAIVLGSKFRPFEYSQLIQPLQMATESHQAMEGQYNQLGTEADLMSNLANEQTDPIAYKMYKTYSDDLKAQADVLASEGLNPTSRQGLLDLRRRYSSEITPIQNAYTRRTSDIQSQRDLISKDNTVMFDRDASLTSLDDYIGNQSLTYTPVSGRDITNRVSQAVQNYKNSLLKAGDWRSTASGQLLERIERRGLTPEDINLIKDNPNAFPEITDLINSVVTSTGVENWNNEDALVKAWGHAYEGLYSGIGKEDVNVQRDQEYMNPLERARMAKLQAEMQEPETPLNRLWDWKGTNVEINSDINAQKLSEDLTNLRQLQSLLDAGEEVPATTTRQVYRDKGLQKLADNLESYIDTQSRSNPNWTPDNDATFYRLNNDLQNEVKRRQSITAISGGSLTKQEVTENPLIKTQKRLAEQYGTSDINELSRKIEGDIKKKAAVNKFAYLNYNTSSQLVRDLSTSLMQGVDYDDEKAIGKRIHKAGDKKTIPTKEELAKILTDEKVQLGINPATNEVRIYSPSMGTYTIDGTAAFNHVNVGNMAGDRYLRALNENYLNNYDETDQRYREALYKDMDAFMRTLDYTYRSGVPAPTSTSSKAGFWSPE